MILLGRLRGLLIAASFVVASMFLLHRGLAIACPADRVASYQSTITPGGPENVGRKVVTDLAQGGKTLRPPGCRLGVVIGASTGFVAASQLPFLQAHFNLPSAWLGYYQTGGNACDLNRLTKLLRRSGVAPDHLVVCVNPLMMADSALGAEPGYFPNVMNFNRQTGDFLLRSKMDVLGRFGQDDPEVVFGPERSPTRMPVGRVWAQVDPFQVLGFYDAVSYPIGGINYRALVSLIRRERRLGAKVTVVVLPETSKFRAKFPPEARRSLLSALESCTGEERPLVLDFSRSLDDSLFSDLHHVNWMLAGPWLLCGEVGRRIREAETNRPTTVQEIPPLGPPQLAGTANGVPQGRH